MLLNYNIKHYKAGIIIMISHFHIIYICRKEALHLRQNTTLSENIYSLVTGYDQSLAVIWAFVVQVHFPM